MKILLATPAYGGLVHTGYHESVLSTVSYFQREFPGFEFVSSILSLSLISTARNVLASQVLADESFTHILFIDADMGFGPSLVARMLARNKPVVGIVAPQRRLDYEAYHQARARTDNQLLARVIANGYVAGDDAVMVEQGSDGRRVVTVVDGFVRVSHTGTGIMLIQRGVLEAMRDYYPGLYLAEPPAHVRALGVPRGGYLQCFEPARDQHGLALGEDVSFCLRWTREMGGEIWANVDEAIIHTGSDHYAGQYLSRLEHSDVEVRFASAAGA